MDQFLKVIPHFVRKITYYHKLKGKTDIYVWGGDIYMVLTIIGPFYPMVGPLYPGVGVKWT